MSKNKKRAFFAYPGQPLEISSSIKLALEIDRKDSDLDIKPWPAMEVFGAYIPDEIKSHISHSSCIIADVSIPNLNVYYEIGYAIGLGKSFLPTVNTSIYKSTENIKREGLFDNIGYETYDNSQQLSGLLSKNNSLALRDLYYQNVNRTQPIFFLDTLRKTDFRNQIVTTLKDKAKFYRSFDPVENPRISAVQLISDVTASSGVLIPYLSSQIEDSERHNLRASFLAGLSHGLGRETLILRFDNDVVPRPADFKDNIVGIRDPRQIPDTVGVFCERALKAINQLAVKRKALVNRTALQELSLGASAAENEFRTLASYFVQTAEFMKAKRGEIRVITGRKGSGKTAIFFQIRDHFRKSANTLVIDLKPESHQLGLFREEILQAQEKGAFDHTVAAFWHFVILTEILLAIYRSNPASTKYLSRNNTLRTEIAELLEQYGVLEPGDFTTRLTRLAGEISSIIGTIRSNEGNISPERITNLIYQNNLPKFRELILKYTDENSEILFLFDNIDKGWPASGVNFFDVKMVQILLEVLEKTARDFTSLNREFIPLTFLRNDIYELLVDQISDRGKLGQVTIDWTDRAKLTQVMFRRFKNSLNSKEAVFKEIWLNHFPEQVSGKDSFEYFLDHCLMRPRFLINIVENAISSAINRGHGLVTEDDCVDAVRQHALTLIDDFGFEIRDVSGLKEDLLYALVGSNDIEESDYFVKKLCDAGFCQEEAEKAFDLMLWYGILGIIDKNGDTQFIYDYQYNIKRLQAEARLVKDNIKYVVNIGLMVGLG